MPLPKPRKGQSQDSWMKECMHELSTPDATDRPQDQKIAICMSAWREAQKADDTPYGDVAYADPGYQKDGKKRYPIDTAEHIRAAWSYINKPENQSAYSSDQVSQIKARIIAAWKRKIDPAGPPGAKALKQMCEPEDDEDYQDFMDRCTGEEGMSDDECQMAWENKSGKAVVHKTHESQGTGMDFVMSDATPDRFGDVIIPEGFDVRDFRRNPVALFNHNKDFIVGAWQNVRVQDGTLQGRLKLAPQGTSARIDEIRKLVEAGILRAVSVGFLPITQEPRRESKTGGITYLKSALVEASLVAIPANPNALSIARSLSVSHDTMRLVFAEHGNRAPGATRRGSNGEHAETNRKQERRGAMAPLATRIKECEQRVVKLKDQLADHMSKIDDENPDEAANATTDELTSRIEGQEKLLANLKRAEGHIMAAVTRGDAPEPDPEPAPAQVQRQVTHFQGGGSSALEVSPRPFAVPAKKVTPLDYLIRSVCVAFKHRVEGGQRTMDQILVSDYGEDITTRAVMGIVTRAASSPATTTGSGWANTLIQTAVGDLVQALTAKSIFPTLSGMGSSYTFDRSQGNLVIPVRTAANLGGGFVAEGSPIPVKAGAFTSITLTPKKLGVITTMTRQAANYTVQSLESIVRDGIVQDTAVALDTILMDNNAASTVRPQGMQNAGGTAKTATAGGAIAALIGDLKTLVGALISNTAGNIRNPVWIMSPGDVLAASLTQAAAGGNFPFLDDLKAGRLLGYPVIQSTTGTGTKPNGNVYLVDAADFISSVGAPMFDVSDQAVLHMEDTSPAALATGTGPTVATPIRSLYQTDSMAIRLLWDLDFAWRRSNMVVWTTAITWD